MSTAPRIPARREPTMFGYPVYSLGWTAGMGVFFAYSAARHLISPLFRSAHRR